ncbi:MAG: hypothetical protein AAF542_21755 [Pseudomonadota bacterium]
MEDDFEKLEFQKLRAEISKLIAETRKINGESFYYPLIVGSTATMAIIAIVKVFL